MKRVLVTGINGFVGRHTVDELIRRGFEVHGLTKRTAPAGDNRVTYHVHDLLGDRRFGTLMAFVRPTHLLHLAWYAQPPLYWSAPVNIEWVAASLDLFSAFAQIGGQRIVAAGTCAEYDWRFGYCSELITPIAPTTVYGQCKDALRRSLEALTSATGISAAWGRLFFLYGPNEHRLRLVPSVVTALLYGREALCTSGEQFRDYLHVQDAADALVALLCSDLTGPINIGSGEAVPVKAVVHEIAHQLHGKHLVRFGAKPDVDGDPPLLVADTRLLLRGTGWIPSCSLSKGIAEAIAWWRNTVVEAGGVRER